MSDTVHATTVAVHGCGVMIVGPSGAGKSDLALRLIDRGAVLVADDRTALATGDGIVRASAPARIAGKLEVRGIGILACPFRQEAPVALVVRLGEEERMPDPRTTIVAGIALPEITIDPRTPAAPIKVEWALQARLTDARRAPPARAGGVVDAGGCAGRTSNDAQARREDDE